MCNCYLGFCTVGILYHRGNDEVDVHSTTHGSHLHIKDYPFTNKKFSTFYDHIFLILKMNMKNGFTLANRLYFYQKYFFQT